MWGDPSVRAALNLCHLKKAFLFEVAYFGDAAQDIAPSLLPGTHVEVFGRLEQDKWTDLGGKIRSKTKIVAERVELLDEQGQPVPNHALQDCELVHTANEINRMVKWKGESSLKPLAGKSVRLHFVMRDLDLYAFQFADRDSI